MQRSPSVRFASSLILAMCWSIGGAAAEVVEMPPAPTQASFADDAVVTLNRQLDAVTQSAPNVSSSASSTLAKPAEPAEPSDAAETSHAAATLPAADAATHSEPAASPETRKARIAALRARLHEHMGSDADPPPEEPPLPPPPGPMIGLRQPEFLESRGISISGWLEQGMTFNGDHPLDRFNGPVANNDRAGEYELNQFWMTIQRPVKTGNGFDIGGRIDLSYGTDWRWNVNDGLEDRINGLDDQTYGLMIPQFYVETAYNDLKVQLGHFDAPMDYESLPAANNLFYSHSYCYTYGVPHQLTGMLADYQLDQNWSVQGGLHRGWDQFEDNNHSIDFLGGIRWQSSDRRTTVSYSLTDGPQDPAGDQNRFVYSLVVQEKLGARSQYILVHDLGVEENAPIGGRQSQWYGLDQYYVYSLNNCWAACLRAEWFRDQDGVIVDGPGTVPGIRAWSGGGFAGNFYEVTAGLNWRPHQNVIFRPEVRYDWYDGGIGTYGLSGQPGLPFNDGRSSTQLLTAADLILLF